MDCSDRELGVAVAVLGCATRPLESCWTSGWPHTTLVGSIAKCVVITSQEDEYVNLLSIITSHPILSIIAIVFVCDTFIRKWPKNRK